MKYHIDPSKLVIHDKVVKKQKFLDNGQLKCEKYWLNGRYHNPNGPAYRVWYNNGQLGLEEYWLNGIAYSKRDYDMLVNEMAY